MHSKRAAMVESQLRGRSIRDERVLLAMQQAERELFVAETLRTQAYDDCALPIEHGQTISQPYMVARMCELAKIESGHRILEIGAGSGYQAAILAQLGAHVVTVERDPRLAELARRNLKAAGITNVVVHEGDGSRGHASEAPYDRILVAAAAPAIPPALLEQLTAEGRLVIPVGDRQSQRLCVWQHTPTSRLQSVHQACVFVPLVGEQGWPELSDPPSQ